MTESQGNFLKSATAVRDFNTFFEKLNLQVNSFYEVKK